ncbi:class II aldolase/adducin family protein [Synechococcus sp. 1G10]|uniref:class II aldolase/adducin family protein n=1 Tax=Synechococcus sp. 1G10 TaxID=2025605 RepID=UPI000B98F1E3|nr:class II aldolase/adducin family protein [Synechococcus sp. 1G10]
MPTSAPGEQARALCAVIAAIHARGWCDGTGGNFSCVSRLEPLELLMAPSGVDKGSIRPQDLILVNAQAQVIDGSGAASAETLLHLEIVKRTGAAAVLHTHSQAATLLSRRALQAVLLRPVGSAAEATNPAEAANAVNAAVRIDGLEMLKGLTGIRSHDTSIAIPVLANDQDLRRLSSAASPHLDEAPHGLLIAGHGLYAWGHDLFSARRHLEILEFLLEQSWRELLLPPLPNP